MFFLFYDKGARKMKYRSNVCTTKRNEKSSGGPLKWLVRITFSKFSIILCEPFISLSQTHWTFFHIVTLTFIILFQFHRFACLFNFSISRPAWFNFFPICFLQKGVFHPVFSLHFYLLLGHKRRHKYTYGHSKVDINTNHLGFYPFCLMNCYTLTHITLTIKRYHNYHHFIQFIQIMKIPLLGCLNRSVHTCSCSNRLFHYWTKENI